MLTPLLLLPLLLLGLLLLLLGATEALCLLALVGVEGPASPRLLLLLGRKPSGDTALLALPPLRPHLEGESRERPLSVPEREKARLRGEKEGALGGATLCTGGMARASRILRAATRVARLAWESWLLSFQLHMLLPLLLLSLLLPPLLLLSLLASSPSSSPAPSGLGSLQSSR
jgi:hypothetical protein